MANDEVLGPRKTMMVLVIVVACFAVLWPRILSPLIVGHTQEHLKPNKFDREAGCCEVIFQSEVAVLELVNEVCDSVLGSERSSLQSAIECRKAVNETCGVDIAVFLKKDENVGKSTKMLVEAMKNTNSSCLREHFGVPVYSLGSHTPVKSWTLQDSLKQERPHRGIGPHPALRERGRAIPPGAPPPGRQQMPPHVRVRSPLSVYFEMEPPPIPGMRPPLGSAGGPVAAPVSSMGFVMPIYTICMIVFFVYTLSKVLFKRAGGTPYDPVTPDPQFRKRVFRDDSRTTPDKLVVTAISGLVAEVEQQMEASQQRQESQDNQNRPFTNGSILLNTGPVQIVASLYEEPNELISELVKSKETLSENTVEQIAEVNDNLAINEASVKDGDEPLDLDSSNVIDGHGTIVETEEFLKEERDVANKGPSTPELLAEALKEDSPKDEVDNENSTVKVLGMEVTAHPADGSAWPGARPPVAPPKPPAPQQHKADEVKSIFLETEIPQQSRVLVADFEDRAQTQKPAKNAPLVVSGKMTLSLIQDAPRDTPERDLESTLDEFTTASAMTQPAAEKDLSDEDLDEEIEVEEIEEEMELESDE